MPEAFKNDAPQVETLGRGIHLMPRFGISVEQIQEGIDRRVAAIDALTEAIRSESYHIQIFGITTHLPSLPSWDEYTNSRDKKHQRGPLAFIRRRLFPRRYRQLCRDYVDAQARIQQEFLDEALSGVDEAPQ